MKVLKVIALAATAAGLLALASCATSDPPPPAHVPAPAHMDGSIYVPSK